MSDPDRLFKALAEADPTDRAQRVRILEDLVRLERQPGRPEPRDDQKELTRRRVEKWKAERRKKRRGPRRPTADDEGPVVVDLDAPEGEEEPRGDATIRVLNGLLLGEILIELGLVSGDSIDYAVRKAHASKTRLGDVLLSDGLVDAPGLQSALTLQEHMRKTSTEPGGGTVPSPVQESQHIETLNELLLGEVLVHAEVITAKKLEEALRLQQVTGMRIGEALVEIGAAPWKEIEAAVRRQAELREERSEAGSADRSADHPDPS